MQDPVQRKYTEVGQVRLSYFEAGATDGDPVLCLHGIPASGELWRGVITELAGRGYHCFAPDLPGYGKTRLPASGDYSLAGAARLLADWLDQAKCEPLKVVGHDLGGGSAQILAATHPELISHLTLGNTVVGDSWPVTPIRLFQIVARTGIYPLLVRLGAMPNPYAWHALRQTFADPQNLDKEAARRIYWDDKAQAGEGARQFARLLRSLDNHQTLTVEKKLADLPFESNLIWGLKDHFQTWEDVGLRLQKALGTENTTLLQNAGHFAMLDQPEAYVEALLEGWRV